MRYLHFCWLITLILHSCMDDKPEALSVMPDKTNDVELHMDTLQIETPGTTREFPYRFPSFDYSNQVFAGLDERTNSINVYDSGPFTISKSIRLHDTGPHAIQVNMVGSVWYHNSDSIFVLQHIPNRLVIVNSNSEIIWQKDLKELFEADKHLKGLMAYALFEKVTMYYRKGKAYFGLRQNQASQDFSNPMIGYYDFEKDKIFTLDIHYPEFYTSNEDVGSYHFPYITWYGDSILFVFPYSPEIFIYDLKGHLQMHVQRPTEFSVGKAPENGESKRSHLLHNPLYLGIPPVQDGQYYVLYSRDEIPVEPDNENFEATIVYNHDFSKYFVLDTNESPYTFGGRYFYYPLIPEESGYQLLQRYKVQFEE